MKRMLILCIGWLAAYPVMAQMRYGNTVTINEPVFENLYIAGATVIINAPIHGDLIVAGGTITINDTITNDILLTGGKVTFNGFVGDDIRCAGGELTILKTVSGDVVLTGGTILIDKAATIGNLMAGGSHVTIDGTVTGTLKCVSGDLVLNGTALKDIDCRGGTIAINGQVQGPAILAASDGITVGRNAGFAGNVRYWTPDKKVDFGQSLQNGQATFDPTLKIGHDRWYYLGFASVVGLVWYASIALVFIMIVQYLFSATMKKAGETAYNAALKSLGYGLLFWVGLPVLAVVVFITVIGVPVALLLLFSYIVLALLATVIASVVAANWLNSRSNTNWHFWRMVSVSFGIFVLLKILTFTPFLGWLIIVALICIAFGAILLNIHWRKRQTVKG